MLGESAPPPLGARTTQLGNRWVPAPSLPSCSVGTSGRDGSTVCFTHPSLPPPRTSKVKELVQGTSKKMLAKKRKACEIPNSERFRKR